MTRLGMTTAFTMVAALTSGPALAHSGGHLHPHGIEATVAIGGVIALLSTVAWLKSR